jgi:uncharacterized membrane protein YfcA
MPQQNQTQVAPTRRNWLTILTLTVIIALVSGYIAVWHAVQSPFLPAADNWLLFLVGIGAATIANSTGVGGGVVFLPTFEFLGNEGLILIAPAQIVAMSFIIQSFGMTTGSITWLNRIYSHKSPDTGISPASFFKLIALILIAALPAMLASQALITAPPQIILFWFKAVSIALGSMLLFTTLRDGNDQRDRHSLETKDILALFILSAFGGVATAFFSVGVGELVALYLFIRGFPLVTSAAVAVIVSALSVLAGVGHHLLAGPQPWELLAFIIPGAMLGGYMANRFAYWLGPKKLKIFAALWIIFSSIYMLIAN